MGKHANLIPSQQLNVALPQPLYVQLCAHLYSDLEQRVPHGAFSRFLTERLREYFTQEHLDLAQYVNCDIGTFVINGSPEAINALKERL